MSTFLKRGPKYLIINEKKGKMGKEILNYFSKFRYPNSRPKILFRQEELPQNNMSPGLANQKYLTVVINNFPTLGY